MAHIVFTTCHQWPDLSVSDHHVAQALEALGHRVTPIPWNDDFARFELADLIVLRANWDYHHDIAAFNAWLDKVEAHRIAIQNPLQLVRWNLHKSYLFDLQRKGIATPTSTIYRPGDDLEQLYRQHQWLEAVVKPIYGASGHMVARIACREISTWMHQYRPQRPGEAWLVQEFRPEIQLYFQHAPEKARGCAEAIGDKLS